MPTTPKKPPMRRCGGCGASFPKRELLRIVRAPGGEVAPDPSGKAAGRGIYLCYSADCLKKAARAKRIERGLEAAVSPETYDSIRDIILQKTDVGRGSPGAVS